MGLLLQARRPQLASACKTLATRFSLLPFACNGVSSLPPHLFSTRASPAKTLRSTRAKTRCGSTNRPAERSHNASRTAHALVDVGAVPFAGTSAADHPARHTAHQHAHAARHTGTTSRACSNKFDFALLSNLAAERSPTPAARPCQHTTLGASHDSPALPAHGGGGHGSGALPEDADLPAGQRECLWHVWHHGRPSWVYPACT